MKRHDISISWLSYDMNTTGHNSVPGNVIYVFYHNDTLCSKKVMPKFKSLSYQN